MSSISLVRHRERCVTLVSVGDDGEAKRPALFQRRIVLRSTDPNMEVELLAGPEFRRGEGAREYVGAGCSGIRCAVDRRFAEGCALRYPFPNAASSNRSNTLSSGR